MIIWGGQGGGVLNSGARYNPGADSWTPTSLTSAPIARDGHTAVWTGTRMIIWGGYGGAYLNSGGRYNPVTDTWISTSTTNAPSIRSAHTAIWTGTIMIVWGGFGETSQLNSGGRYDPISNSWSSTSIINAPAARERHTAVWASTVMIVWGGYYNDGSNHYLNTGGTYDPTANLWTPTSMINIPATRYYHTAVWTGTEMIVWGGDSNPGYLDSGGRYNPSADLWIPTSLNIPVERTAFTAVWTGTELIIWGGYGAGFMDTGGRYDLITNVWTSTSMTNAPLARDWHTAVWTGKEMIIWGGYNAGYLSSGAKYNPVTDIWTATSPTNAPSNRWHQTAIWTGSEMIIWGGSGTDYFNTGGKYNPTADSWTLTSTTNTPMGRNGHAAVWTGTDMIVWGGYYYDGSGHYLDTGGRYNPSTDSWFPTSMINAPLARASHTAVWTDSEMIIWGGYGGGYKDTGGKYNPSTDSWFPTSMTNAPLARASHTAVWTDSEMIIWGGHYYDGSDHFLDAGGRYNPIENSWTPTSTTNAPRERIEHAAVWTGTEMIVWGGENSLPFEDSMGIYCACRSTPLNVTVTPSLNQITVNWSLVPEEDIYNVFRRYAHCSQQIEELIGDHVPGDTFIDSTVNPGKLNEYNVKSSGQCESIPGTWVLAQSLGECVLLPCFSGIEIITNNQCAITIQWHDAVSDCETSPDISYAVYRSDTPDFIPSPSNQIVACWHDNFYVNNNVTPGLTYYYIVRAEDSSSNGTGPCNNGNIDSNLMRKSGTASAPILALFFDGFESGMGNWLISSNWQQTNLYAHTGVYSAYPLYENNLQCALMTQANAITIPSAALTPQLHFWTKYNIENGLDAGIVEGSSDGNIWTKLAFTPDYPGTTVSSAQDCLGVNPQSAYTGNLDSWTEYASDLTTYIGTEFKVRFDFATNDSITNTGWFIDDVNIDYRSSSCTSNAPPAGKVLNNLFVAKSNGIPKLDWTPVGGTCTVTNYAVYRGTLPWTFYNHNYITCYVPPVPPFTYADINAPGSYYYLIVPFNSVHEGSYGTTSSGMERPQGTSACKWQKLLSCE